MDQHYSERSYSYGNDAAAAGEVARPSDALPLSHKSDRRAMISSVS
jgi:hypothetical protein